MNYTIQQKQYNNRLTEKLLELATENGYIFDEAEFSFVTVRDRIRCYYKSYVQSAKKRGILMGYAARKAGILSSQDLSSSGEIIDPWSIHYISISLSCYVHPASLNAACSITHGGFDFISCIFPCIRLST